MSWRHKGNISQVLNLSNALAAAPHMCCCSSRATLSGQIGSTLICFAHLILRHLKVQRIFSSSDGQVSNLINFKLLLAFSKVSGERRGEKAEGGTN